MPDSSDVVARKPAPESGVGAFTPDLVNPDSPDARLKDAQATGKLVEKRTLPSLTLEGPEPKILLSRAAVDAELTIRIPVGTEAELTRVPRIRLRGPEAAQPAPRIRVLSRPTNTPAGADSTPEVPGPAVAEPAPRIRVLSRPINTPAGANSTPEVPGPAVAEPAPRIRVLNRPTNTPAGANSTPEVGVLPNNVSQPGETMVGPEGITGQRPLERSGNRVRVLSSGVGKDVESLVSGSAVSRPTSPGGITFTDAPGSSGRLEQTRPGTEDAFKQAREELLRDKTINAEQKAFTLGLLDLAATNPELAAKLRQELFKKPGGGGNKTGLGVVALAAMGLYAAEKAKCSPDVYVPPATVR